MFWLKLWYHFCAVITKLFFKLVYNKRVKFGKNVTWRRKMSLMIDKDAKVVIGENCFFNNYCSINSNKNICIGNDCLFGENVKLYDHNHRFSNGKILIKDQGFSNGIISIGNNCWIGSNVIILKDTIIGDNCVIGAGCIISGDIPPKTIVKNSYKLSYAKMRLE